MDHPDLTVSNFKMEDSIVLKRVITYQFKWWLKGLEVEVVGNKFCCSIPVIKLTVFKLCWANCRTNEFLKERDKEYLKVRDKPISFLLNNRIVPITVLVRY